MIQEPQLGPVVVQVTTEGRAGLLDWIVGRERPDGHFGQQIVRMFVTEYGVEIYCRAGDPGQAAMCCRRLVPWRRVSDVEEMMSEEVFAQEIAAAQQAAESESDDGDDDDETEEEAKTGTHP